MRVARRAILLAFAMTIVIATAAQAQSLRLTWDATQNATGYRVSYGTQPGPPYASTIDVGSQTSRLISDLVPSLVPGRTYYFAVQAYNQSGPSGYSSEISWTIPVPATTSLREGLDFNGDDLGDVFAFNPVTSTETERPTFCFTTPRVGCFTKHSETDGDRFRISVVDGPPVGRSRSLI